MSMQILPPGYWRYNERCMVMALIRSPYAGEVTFETGCPGIDDDGSAILVGDVHNFDYIFCALWADLRRVDITQSARKALAIY
jgi:hypothetical protein